MKRMLVLFFCMLAIYLIYNRYNLEIKLKTQSFIEIFNTNTLVLGDSRAEKMICSKFVKTKCFGFGGITTYAYWGKLLPLVVKYSPQQCIIQIGINDIRANIPIDTTMSNFEKLTNNLNSHKVTPIITSIIPILFDYQINNNPENINKSVDSLNNALKKMCLRKNILYIDIASVVTDKNKQLNKLYTTDGIHLNQLGYDKTCGILTSIIK